MIRSVPLLKGASTGLYGRVCANFLGYIRVPRLAAFLAQNHCCYWLLEPNLLSRYCVKIKCPSLGDLGFCAPYNMCIETRAGRLLCDTKIEYSPPHICSGEDDKPSLNPSGEKHREQTYPIAAFIHACKLQI